MKSSFNDHTVVSFALDNAFAVTVKFYMSLTGHHPHADQDHAAGPFRPSIANAVVAVIATEASVAVGVAAGKCFADVSGNCIWTTQVFLFLFKASGSLEPINIVIFNFFFF